jgi:beta-lactamase superfamily II metal-dependent hydrolase
MRSLLIALSVVALASAWPFAQTRAAGALSIYVVDVEGGNATLFVSPAGESLLIDAGNPGARDADRIVAAAKDAGLKQIDDLIVTHYHGDHVGGVADLASRIPIRRFIDHGPSVEKSDATTKMLEPYVALTGKAAHMAAKPGDRIPVAGLDVTIVASAGAHITKPLPRGGTPNAACASFTKKDPDTSENAQSVGSVITFGSFRAAHLGDLTWNNEYELMCPSNPIGAVDLFLVSHHGLEVSNSAALVHALRPRVAIMNNGIRKGGAPDTMKTLYSSPGLEDLWQLHFSLLGGQEYAVPGLFIANEQPDLTVPVAPAPAQPAPAGAPGHDGPAFWIKVVAQSNGAFVVTNSRNSFSKTYAAGPGQRGRASTAF